MEPRELAEGEIICWKDRIREPALRSESNVSLDLETRKSCRCQYLSVMFPTHEKLESCLFISVTEA